MPLSRANLAIRISYGCIKAQAVAFLSSTVKHIMSKAMNKSLKLDTYPVYGTTLSSKDFIKAYPMIADNISSIQPVPCRLGSTDFGSFRITYKEPVYTPLLNLKMHL